MGANMNKFTSVVVYSGKNELYRFETSPEKWSGGALREVDDSDYIAEKKITCTAAEWGDMKEFDYFAGDGSIRKVKAYSGGRISELELIGSNSGQFDLMIAYFDFDEKLGSIDYLLNPESRAAEIAAVAHTADGKHLCVHRFAPEGTGSMNTEDFSIHALRKISGKYYLTVVMKDENGKIIAEVK